MTTDLLGRPDEDDATGEFATEAPRPVRVGVEIGGRTHPGKVRPNNEDQFLVAKLAKSMRICATSLPVHDRTRFSDEEGYLMIVADGMGGAAAGEQASAVAVRTIEEFVLDTVKWFLHLGGQEESVLMSELRRGLERADRDVIARAHDDRRLAGMGTTLTFAYSVGTDLFLVHAGDTRAYLSRGGDLEQVTTDHTLVQLLVNGGVLTPEAAKTHSRRNVVTNVVGGPAQGVQAEIHKVNLRDGDALLLCTDGLSGPLEDPEIAAILDRHANPDQACQALVAAALERGAPDNVTVVLARYRVLD